MHMIIKEINILIKSLILMDINRSLKSTGIIDSFSIIHSVTEAVFPIDIEFKTGLKS